ncbi:hypothetical protein ACA910_014297 [Epithemia clementina (nom. ined.)]
MAKSTFVSLVSGEDKDEDDDDDDNRKDPTKEVVLGRTRDWLHQLQPSLDDCVLLLLSALTLQGMCVLLQQSLPTQQDRDPDDEDEDDDEDAMMTYKWFLVDAQHVILCLCSSVDEIELWTCQIISPCITSAAA